MKRLLFALYILVVDTAHGLPWPAVSNPVITSCNDGSSTCSSSVYYAHSGTVFNEIEPVIPPPTFFGTVIRAYGVHCDKGSRLPGEEEQFTKCYWDANPPRSHAPATTGECELVDLRSWELREGSSCQTTSTWGVHSGAGPGGECVLFGLATTGFLYSPMGTISASDAANSGNHWCVKPLPPSVTCDLRLSDHLLDHGSMAPDGVSTASVRGELKCGVNPKVEIVGGGDFMIAAGVHAQLDATVYANTNVLNLSSRVTTVNAQAGDYTANRVITVSPW